MAHIRSRYLHSQVTEALRYSPLVGILGQRQVGKTTLMESIVSDSYRTFDDGPTLLAAQLHPKAFLESFNTTTGIDECQLAPEIFSALKLRVQANRRPGQFLLSGSVRFTSRKLIRESLTGRIVNFELLPMTFAESQHQLPQDYSLLFREDFGQLLQKLRLRQRKLPFQHLDRYLLTGGLPGICFLRKEAHRRNKMRSHLETLLQRDLRLVVKTTTSNESLLMLLSYLAQMQGRPFSIKEASKRARVAQNTVKVLLAAFEALFLIRRVPGLGFRTGPTFFLEDQGMATYLLENQKENYFERLMFSQIFSNIHYTHSDRYQMGYYEFKSGLKIDLIAKLEKETIGFLFQNAEVIQPAALRAAEAFLGENPRHRIVILTLGDVAHRLDPKMIQMPLGWIA